MSPTKFLIKVIVLLSSISSDLEFSSVKHPLIYKDFKLNFHKK